jgi:hypothetical protein
MKTAMQELKEEIQSKVFPPTYNDGNLTDYQYGHNVAYGVVLTIVEYLLEKEKEQITKAWDDGDYAYFYNKETGRDFENGEEYYNQTYNQKIPELLYKDGTPMRKVKLGKEAQELLD